MANFNIRSRNVLLILALLFLSVPLFGNKLFYLSTDRTYGVDELKKIKVESGSLNEVKIRVYRINDTQEYFLDQEDFHRPKVVGRRFRYVTPEVVKGFKNYLKKELRGWARTNIPGKNRRTIINQYNDLSTKDEERYYVPSKQVDYIQDENFSLVEEKKYFFERRNNNWNTNYVYFNSLKPGTYLIEGITGGKLAYTVLNVSPFSFIAKKAGDKLLLYSVNNKTGEPASDISYTVYDRFRNRIKSVESSGDGLATFSSRHDDIFIVANDIDGNFSFYDPRYYPSAVSDRNVYLYTDRPVYKGGDEILFKGIIRDIKKGRYYKTAARRVKFSIWNGDRDISGQLDAVLNNEGSFSGGFKLPEETSSGIYRIKAHIDDKEYDAEFKVEYYVKPEFKVSVKSGKNTYLTGEKIIFNLQSEFYHGEPLGNAKVKYVISRMRYSYKEMGNQGLNFYLSGQEWVYTGVERLSSSEMTLDGKGQGQVEFIVDDDAIKGNTPYTYILTATVSNEGGADVTAAGSSRIVPSNLRIGLNTHKFVYLQNETITVEIDTVDYDKNPLSIPLEVRIISKSGGEDKLLSTKKVKSDDKGKTYIEFDEKNGGFVSVEVTGKDLAGNSVTSEKHVWIGEEGASYSLSGGFIKLVLDKSYYSTSEDAKLLIVSPIADIPMLLTIEGTEIYSTRNIRLKENSALIDIPVKDQYLPNAFISLDFIYENRHYHNSIKLDIPPVEKFLNIDLIPEKETYLPESKGKVRVVVTDNKGKVVPDTELSIAVVDEAIYGISEDLAVDIRKFFYHFRRNNVMTWTSSGFRFYGYAYNVKRELAEKYYRDATGIASFKGGDEDEAERKEFKDAIFWAPDIMTNEKGEAEITIDFPSNITSWRITAIAVDPDHRVGLARENVITKKDIFTNVSHPVQLNEFDESLIYINLHNNSSVEKELKVVTELSNLEGRGLNEIIALKSYETVILEQKVSSINTGKGGLEVIVTEKDKIHDHLTKTFDINHHSLEKNISFAQTFTASNNTMEVNKPSDMKADGSALSFSFTNSYAGHIVDSLEYLATYPHGCVEQTTNRFLPNLAAAGAFKEAGIPLNSMDKTLDANINAGLTSLTSYQNEDGSWGWWNEGEIDLYMTSYVLYGFTQAKKLGYLINGSVLEKGLGSIKNNLDSGSETEKLFALYILSLNGIRVESVYNSYNYESLSDYELALLLLTSRNYRDNKTATSIYPILEERGRKHGKGIYWGEENSVDWRFDNVETSAWVLRALSAYSGPEILNSITGYLLSQKRDGRWKSTRDTSAVVLALSSVLSNIDGGSGNYRIQLNGREIRNFSLDSKLYHTRIIFGSEVINTLKDRNSFKITGLGDEGIFGTLNLKYHTTGEKIEKGESGASITRKYYSLNESRGDFSLGREISSISKGENFIVELDYKQAKPGEYIMISDNYPAGSIYNKDIDVLSIKGIGGTIPEAIDNRYGKIHFFFTQSGDKKIYYVLKANYPGNYATSPATGELMYFPDYSGNSESDIFEIKEGNK